jgi:hypothetical protein
MQLLKKRHLMGKVAKSSWQGQTICPVEKIYVCNLFVMKTNDKKTVILTAG